MKKVDIVYFDAGSGHRSSARGLERALAAARPDWRVRMVNIVDVFAPNKQFHRIVCAGIGHFNRQLKREKVFDLKGLINLSLMFHDFLSSKGMREISDFWKDEPPDVVVSVTPMYNPALYRAALMVNPKVQCITIPVDFEEVKARYWFTPKINQHYLVATTRLEQQARAAGIPQPLIHRISGMPIDTEFYEEPRINVPEELERLGLDPELPTGLVSFGGQGSVLVAEIAKSLAKSTLKLNVIFLCGRHSEVYEALNKLETPYRKLVLSYTRETPIYYQRLAQFIIGKPGSMTITEALIARKPVIAIKSRGMSPVQRGNEEWVQERKVGIIVAGMDELPAGVSDVIGSDCYRQNAAREFHRGVFEAAEHICALAEGRAPGLSIGAEVVDSDRESGRSAQLLM
jgi:processive 1,2-diacylglycerol beta-glucosyltransferase